MTTQTYRVAGMSCQHCVDAVTSELSELDGVEQVQVDLEHSAVTVTSDQSLEPAEVAAAIEEAGYELTGTVQ